MAAARSAKAIFSASASKCSVSGRAEAQSADVEAFQNVEHLDDMQRPGGGRRRPGDFEAAIRAADRLARDGAVARQVIPRNIAAGPRHVIRVMVAERAGVEMDGPSRAMERNVSA